MKRSEKNRQPNWRPNFVNASDLPDIKVVRTNFIINFVAVALALVMVGMFLSREYKLRSLETTIDRLESRISKAESVDKKSLRLSREFKDVAAYIVEVGKFLDTPFYAHELVQTFASIQPDDLIYKSIDVSEKANDKDDKKGIAYQVALSGDAKSLTVLDEFKRILAQADALKFPGYSIEIDETLQGRDEETGIFPYRLNISFIPGAPDQKQGKDAS
ncbi:MAG: hypothetical protein GVY36_07885 [Verrucomicrobia bacterium]|jgi:hypothetical protein|nr:hypothetical protein [Verrucomicrobiota bacterium]